MLEVSQLQTLVAVARAKSFSKAAEQLSVTQSAISQSVKNLEKKLEVNLFKRSGKRVVLTQEGEKLYGIASDFLAQLDDTVDEIRQNKDSMIGKVRIGTLTGVGKSWLAHHMLEFSKEHRDLTVALTLGFQEDLVKDFLNYRLDILILPEEHVPPVGEKVLLSEEKSALVFPDSDEFKVTKDMSWEQLASFPTILFEMEDPLYSNWFREKFGVVPKRPNVKYVVNSHGNMLDAVSQGVGMAVVPVHVLARSFYKDKVKTLGKKYEVSNGKFFIVYHKESEGLLRIKETIKSLKAVKNPLATGLHN